MFAAVLFTFVDNTLDAKAYGFDHLCACYL